MAHHLLECPLPGSVGETGDLLLVQRLEKSQGASLLRRQDVHRIVTLDAVYVRFGIIGKLALFGPPGARTRSGRHPRESMPPSPRDRATFGRAETGCRPAASGRLARARESRGEGRKARREASTSARVYGNRRPERRVRTRPEA